MGPGFNQLEYETTVLRQQELAAEYRKVQRSASNPNGGPHRLRSVLSNTGRQISGTLKMITSAF